AHAEEWPVLAQALASRTLILPHHARLREELLNLVVEVGPQGVKVIDRGQVHPDHAVAVRGVVASLAKPAHVPMRFLSLLPDTAEPTTLEPDAAKAERETRDREMGETFATQVLAAGGAWMPGD